MVCFSFCLKNLAFFFIILPQALVFINKLEIFDQRKLLKSCGKYFDKK